jgi:hypothetical protein
MPVIYREDGSTAWGAVAALLIAVALIIGFALFYWAGPRTVGAEGRDNNTTIIQPAPSQPSAPDVVPVPVPSPNTGGTEAPSPSAPASPGE